MHTYAIGKHWTNLLRWKRNKREPVKKVKGGKKKSEIIQGTHEGHGENHSYPSIKKIVPNAALILITMNKYYSQECDFVRHATAERSSCSTLSRWDASEHCCLKQCWQSICS